MKKFDFSKEFGNIDPKYIEEAEGQGLFPPLRIIPDLRLC